MTEKSDGWYLTIQGEPWASDAEKCQPVTTALLGVAKIPNEAFENADGSPINLDTDYFGKPRDMTNPYPGPFELPEGGAQSIKVWPK